MQEENLISLEVFANRYNKKEETVKRNISKIPGAIKKENIDYFCDSARYPYSLRNNKMKTSADRRYLLLLATSKFEYIDEKMLKMSKCSFNTMIKELIEKGLLVENGSNNKNGANAYDCSSLAEEILQKNRVKAMEELGKVLASIAGTFVNSATNKSKIG